MQNLMQISDLGESVTHVTLVLRSLALPNAFIAIYRCTWDSFAALCNGAKHYSTATALAPSMLGLLLIPRISAYVL